MDTRYHPSLLIMAKTLPERERYLDTTKILQIAKNATPINATYSAYADTDGDLAEAEGPPEEEELLKILEEVDPVKKPRKSLRETQKKFAYETNGLKNLQLVWDHCDANDIEEYKDWYKKANADCKRLAKDLRKEIEIINPPDPVRMVVGVVAATSQGTLWEENLNLASEVITTRDVSNFKVSKEGGDEDDSGGYLKITKNNLEKVKSILAGDFSVLESDKFGAFFTSILDPHSTENTVVVDTHATGIWIGARLGVQDPLFQENKPAGARLAAIVRDYRKLAGSVGYTPQSVQAVTWSVWRKLPPGYKTKFMDYGEGKHPEVVMFKAFYPFLYTTMINKKTGLKGKKSNWRWRYTRFDDIMRPENMSDEALWKKGYLCQHKGSWGKCGTQVVKTRDGTWTHVIRKDDRETREAGMELDQDHQAKPGDEPQRIKERLGGLMPKTDWELAKQMYHEMFPHHSPNEFIQVVKRYGRDLHEYYGFPEDAWKEFMEKYPNFGEGLDDVRDRNVAAMMESAARRIIRLF